MVGWITIGILFLAGAAALAVQLWALIDCLLAKPQEFERSDKRTKSFWTAITAFSAVMGALYLLVPGLNFPLLLNMAACVGAGTYLADVRPALREIRRGGNRRMGPYGPW
ncbi:DUF2516 family protein [Psychromicrobium xiongbiense]|uniref:DUF2516 family protein n=1 Tax=Psychromicrobium xiongbiense TaxID=3051184 RepID=UPI002555BF4E|nr:DUF2516 family protein [Psychromicrobium sp. YIM S02556]